MRTIKGYITADGFAKVTAAEAYRYYPMVEVSWREYRNFIRMWGAEL